MTDSASHSSNVKFKGSCACGRITYDCTEAPITGATNTCHCITCRKLSGGPYQAFTDVRPGALIYYDKHQNLRYDGLPKDSVSGIVFLRFHKSGAAERVFCASCYTPLAMRYMHQPDVVNVVLGSVDEGSICEGEGIKGELRLQSHIFVGQRAWWCEIEGDGLPTFERFSGRFEDDMKEWERRCDGKEK